MGFNIKNNYGPNIEVNEGGVVNLHQNRDGRWFTKDAEEAEIVNVVKPDKLATPKAEELMEDLIEGGVLKDDWQPNGLSGSERALVAKTISDRLDIKEVWQVFGQLWNEKPETLRSYLNKALDQRKSLLFQEKLKKMLG